MYKSESHETTGTMMLPKAGIGVTGQRQRAKERRVSPPSSMAELTVFADGPPSSGASPIPRNTIRVAHVDANTLSASPMGGPVKRML